MDDEYADVGERVQCEDCGRMFGEAATEKHLKICKKVFCEKRKKFNSAANRLGDQENAAQLIKNAQKIEKQVEAKKDAPGEAKAKEKAMPKWKRESLEFRAAMLAAKGSEDPDKNKAALAAVQAELGAAGPAVDPSKVVCPHCSRSFNKEAGERHVAICQNLNAKKGARLVKGGGTSASAAKVGPPTAAQRSRS